MKERTCYLAKKYDHVAAGARNTLCFGPEGMGPNIMVNITKEVQYVKKINDSVVTGKYRLKLMCAKMVCNQIAQGTMIINDLHLQ